MFGPSVTAAYATQALACLARNAGVVCTADTIASESGVPRSYLIKILHTLKRQGLVVTHRGAGGGYRLAGDPGKTSLYDILSIVDGPDQFDRCLAGLGRCSPKRRCPFHPVWAKQRRHVERWCRELTLRELVTFDRQDFERDYRFGFGGRGRQDPPRQ